MKTCKLLLWLHFLDVKFSVWFLVFENRRDGKNEDDDEGGGLSHVTH